ncbi:MAG: DUF896 domain-containing protein [Hyphomonadaceae bacterium]|nr:DUF896 domain-containing protein [Clostridia bacterium]
MLSKEKIERINVLAKKSKELGLTPEEKEEQQMLRQEYLQNLRTGFKGMLENIEIIDE